MDQQRSPTSSSDSSHANGAELGRRIREAREARALSQTATATRSKWNDPDGKGFSRTSLIGYEAGTSRPGARELELLCRTLMVSPNMLLFGTEHPFDIKHAAMESMRSDTAHELRQAVATGLALAVLKGHERDALMSLTFSLAGRQLGDVRLGGLHMLAAMLEPQFQKLLLESLPAGTGPENASLEALATALSKQQGSNMGNSLQLGEDGEVIGGIELYPDPEKR